MKNISKEPFATIKNLLCNRKFLRMLKPSSINANKVRNQLNLKGNVQKTQISILLLRHMQIIGSRFIHRADGVQGHLDNIRTYIIVSGPCCPTDS